MKTAISVPDTIFYRVADRAATLGISRSEFFAHAATRYLTELDSQSLTARINAALAPDDDSNAIAAAVGRQRLAANDDSW